MSGQSETNQKKVLKLRSCKLCETEISPYSLFCRNCGHPQGSPLAIALLVLFLLFLLAMYVGFMLFCASNPERFEIQSTTSHAPGHMISGDRTMAGRFNPSIWTGDRFIRESHAAYGNLLHAFVGRSRWSATMWRSSAKWIPDIPISRHTSFTRVEGM